MIWFVFPGFQHQKGETGVTQSCKGRESTGSCSLRVLRALRGSNPLFWFGPQSSISRQSSMAVSPEAARVLSPQTAAEGDQADQHRV